MRGKGFEKLHFEGGKGFEKTLRKGSLAFENRHPVVRSIQGQKPWYFGNKWNKENKYNTGIKDNKRIPYLANHL